MDSKTIALSLLIAVIMGSSGAVVYTLNTTNADAEEEPVETTQDSKVENQPPKLMIDEEITRTWDGTNMFVEGYVTTRTSHPRTSRCPCSTRTSQ